MKRDFAQLYSQLGLRPDCTFEEFKRAYRRRIAALHPDKGRQLDTPENRALLPDLIKLYATATRFHRRHGRLPGARPALSAPGRAANAPAVTRASRAREDGVVLPAAMEGSERDGPPADTRPRRPVPLALALLVLALAIALAWNLPQPGRDVGSVGTIPREPSETAEQVRSADVLELGMDKASVLAIQGEPFSTADDEWDYGPSWVRFERGRVSDWHSSQLAPLKTDTAEPPPVVEATIAARR